MTKFMIAKCEVCGCAHEAEDVVFQDGGKIRVRYFCPRDMDVPDEMGFTGNNHYATYMCREG